jgi:hypothetical protein
VQRFVEGVPSESSRCRRHIAISSHHVPVSFSPAWPTSSPTGFATATAASIVRSRAVHSDSDSTPTRAGTQTLVTTLLGASVWVQCQLSSTAAWGVSSAALAGAAAAVVAASSVAVGHRVVCGERLSAGAGFAAAMRCVPSPELPVPPPGRSPRARASTDRRLVRAFARRLRRTSACAEFALCAVALRRRRFLLGRWLPPRPAVGSWCVCTGECRRSLWRCAAACRPDRRLALPPPVVWRLGCRRCPWRIAARVRVAVAVLGFAAARTCAADGAGWSWVFGFCGGGGVRAAWVQRGGRCARFLQTIFRSCALLSFFALRLRFEWTSARNPPLA